MKGSAVVNADFEISFDQLLYGVEGQLDGGENEHSLQVGSVDRAYDKRRDEPDATHQHHSLAPWIPRNCYEEEEGGLNMT